MKLRCPNCKYLLPPILPDYRLQPGQSVQCGLCHHRWIPFPAETPLLEGKPPSGKQPGSG